MYGEWKIKLYFCEVEVEKNTFSLKTELDHCFVLFLCVVVLLDLSPINVVFA